MSKRISFIVLILLFLISLDIAYAQSENTGPKSSLEELKPSYVILTRLNTTSINPGESINLGIYFSGFGKVERTKLFVFTSAEFIDKNEPIKLSYSQFTMHENRCENLGPPEKMADLERGGALISLPSCYFSAALYTESEIAENYLPPIFSEMTLNRTHPLSLIIKTKDRSFFNWQEYPYGDNEIALVFTYTDGAKWISTERIIKLHINSFWEEHNLLYAAIIALIGVIVVGVASFIWNAVSKKIKQD